MTRWKIVFTTSGECILLDRGEAIAGSDDLHLLLSYFGWVTGQTPLAAVS